ncbi:hypothetical protein CU097_002188 [Rhizopus azygosporus]|nr:hypothetical protein CU097_002188 [Rhizopus azygosporus]
MKTRFPEGLDELSIATILKQALEALIYLHKNGHIHRDVKAGNLLMDEDGTVLLGDFGVSSSLMESGEKGMRKTFVGTPCWMAPEVMEQAEYDYKADIWSFGITAIELATGHAPFAKYPPLKVLMMTLSNDPPTLERETTMHKYSKAFKDMIDSCLVKDPNKRPTAEKLIQHSFFKQAKKKEYLVKTILTELPPLEQRPRKKIPQKQITITKIDDAWDFGDGNHHDEDNEAIDQNNVESSQSNAQSQKQKTSTPKRHISFGDVIIRTNSTGIHPAESSSTNISSTPPRKSRFVIEETVRDHTDTYSSSVRSSSPMPEDKDADHHSDSEIVKGRFYVNHPKSAPTIVTESSQFEDSQSLHKVASQDLLTADRKSRFEIQHSSVPGSPMIYQPVPLSRDSSYSSAGNSNHSRSNLITRYPTSEPKDLLTSENIALLTESSRKIGRFELTSSNDAVTTSRGSVSSNNTIMEHDIMHIQSQIEELLRYNESQRSLLQDLSLAFQHRKAINIAPEPSYSSNSSVKMPISEELSSTVEHLEKLIQCTLRENAQLLKENEQLRKELKELKK